MTGVSTDVGKTATYYYTPTHLYKPLPHGNTISIHIVVFMATTPSQLVQTIGRQYVLLKSCYTAMRLYFLAHIYSLIHIIVKCLISYLKTLTIYSLVVLMCTTRCNI
jgi:hypothetical protein